MSVSSPPTTLLWHVEGDGAAVGARLGAGVGRAVGSELGCAVGSAVGMCVGAAVGIWVGDSVGASVGDSVGLAVLHTPRLQIPLSQARFSEHGNPGVHAWQTVPPQSTPVSSPFSI